MNTYRYVPRQYRRRTISDFTKEVAAWLAVACALAFITAQVVFG